MELIWEEEERDLNGAGVWVRCHLGLSVSEAFGKEVPR